MTPRRTIIIDMLLLFAVTVLALVTAWALVFSGVPHWVLPVSLAGLAALAIGSAVARLIQRPDHLRALQSQQILDVANESLGYLRKGLTEESASAVCGIILERTEVAAVAITDRERILGFVGIGQDHHAVGGPILTRATRGTLEDNEHRILSTREEIGCATDTCLLRAAIVVPLEMRGRPVGTLKFYYTTPRLLNETQVAMAEGLARLLSTQLELSELERQTELATRMELKALQAQINPHFLFNTINTIAMLIRTDPERARELLREFARFYRSTLETTGELVPLAREVEYVHMYVRLERARFEERLSFSERISPEVREFSVPAFSIQPIVENAVKHGLRPGGVLHVELMAGLEDGSIVVQVADDGVGIPASLVPKVLEPGFGKGLGIALSNVNDRLKGHYGPGSGISVESIEGEGTRVRLVMVPYAKLGGDDDAQSPRR